MDDHYLLLFVTWVVGAKFLMLITLTVLEVSDRAEMRRLRSLRAEATTLLKILKGYLERVEQEHRDVVSEVKPVAEAALQILEQDVRPTLASVEPKIRSVENGAANLEQYTRDTTHKNRDVLQSIMFKLDELKALLTRSESKGV